MRGLWTNLALRFLAASVAAFAEKPEWPTGWSYNGADGPERWGDLHPEYAACKLGREQSPIDIRTTVKSELPALRFVNRSGPLNIVHNGFTAVRVNYAPGNGNLLIVGEKRHEMIQFHFHQPSEEQIHGQRADMGLHLLYQDKSGAIAAVAVLLRAGAGNAVIEELWRHMPKAKCSERRIEGVEINPAGLLPGDAGYYTYRGSLTAPPCTEGIPWFVLKRAVEISREQIDAFARICPDNIRPVQPLNDRIVRESQ